MTFCAPPFLAIILLLSFVFQVTEGLDSALQVSKEGHVQRLNGRMHYDSLTATVRVTQATTPELGFNPSLNEKELHQILSLKKVETLAFYSCRVDCRDLERILNKHKPKRLTLSCGRDETCALLSRFKTVASIEFFDGDVTVSGFIFLSRLPRLKSLHVATQNHRLVSVKAVKKFFPEIDLNISLTKCIPVNPTD